MLAVCGPCPGTRLAGEASIQGDGRRVRRQCRVSGRAELSPRGCGPQRAVETNPSLLPHRYSEQLFVKGWKEKAPA